MFSLRLRTTSGQCEWPLDGPDIWASPGLGLRGRKWSRTLSGHALTGLSVDAREVEMDVTIVDNGNPSANPTRMAEFFDADLDAGTPGQLVMDGIWTCPVYVPEVSTSKVSRWAVQQKWTVVLLDVWRRRMDTVSFDPFHSEDDTWLDLPFDIPFDLKFMSIMRQLDAYGGRRRQFEMTVYGPVTNPAITIGDNVYEVDVDVPAGAVLKISSIDRTITLTMENGDTTNAFDNGVRGNGAGSGHYIFEPLPADTADVTWANNFGFDLTPIEEMTDPSWLI